MQDSVKREKVLVVKMDQAELACRLIEGMYGVKRPAGANNEAALSVMGPDDREAVMRAAFAAPASRRN